MAVKKKATKKIRARKKPTRGKTARKKRSEPAESKSDSGEAFFILLDAPPAPATVNAIQLPVDCSVDNISELHETLTLALSRGEPITVDACALKHLDGASLQLLYAFARDAVDGGLAVEWKNPPDRLGQAAASLGLAAHLPPN